MKKLKRVINTFHDDRHTISGNLKFFFRKVEWIKCKISGTLFLFELIYLLIIHRKLFWEVEEGHIQKMFPARNTYTGTFFTVLVIQIKTN